MSEIFNKAAIDPSMSETDKNDNEYYINKLKENTTQLNLNNSIHFTDEDEDENTNKDCELNFNKVFFPDDSEISNELKTMRHRTKSQIIHPQLTEYKYKLLFNQNQKNNINQPIDMNIKNNAYPTQNVNKCINTPIVNIKPPYVNQFINNSQTMNRNNQRRKTQEFSQIQFPFNMNNNSIMYPCNQRVLPLMNNQWIGVQPNNYYNQQTNINPMYSNTLCFPQNIHFIGNINGQNFFNAQYPNMPQININQNIAFNMNPNYFRKRVLRYYSNPTSEKIKEILENCPKETNSKIELILAELNSSLLNTEKIDYFIYSKLKGNFIDVIKTHKGSRIFQKYLKNTHVDIIHQIYKEINSNLVEILNDSYANYFIKKFFVYLNQKDRVDFLQRIQTSLISLSLSSIGTYPIQGIIEQVGSKIEKKIILNSILSSIDVFCVDTYGTHIIEKMLNCFEEDLTNPIIEYISDNFLDLANNNNGICVAKKVLSFTHKKKLHEKLKKDVINNLFSLVEQPYGNYVIKVIIEKWDDSEVDEIVSPFVGKYSSLSLQKYGSNIVESLIEKNQSYLKYFIDEVSSNGRIAEVMKSCYGNYVVQKALKIVQGQLKSVLNKVVSNNIHKLNDSKLISKWKFILESHLN